MALRRGFLEFLCHLSPLHPLPDGTATLTIPASPQQESYPRSPAGAHPRREQRRDQERPPLQAIRSYRSITGMPDIGERSAGHKSDGTVAFTLVDGTPVFGVNSDAPGYTVRDEAMAREMRARLIERFPEVMATGNAGQRPNDALFHAETNVLLRAAEAYGGSLSGRTIDLRVDTIVSQL